AVAVVVDPGGAGQVVAGLPRQQVAVVAELAFTQISVELGPANSGQEQVRLTVAVIVGPHCCSATLGQAGGRPFQTGIAGILQQCQLAGAIQAEVRFAISFQVNYRDALNTGAQVSQRRPVAEARHTVQPVEVLTAPTDKVALGIVVEQFAAGAQALNRGP